MHILIMITEKTALFKNRPHAALFIVPRYSAIIGEIAVVNQIHATNGIPKILLTKEDAANSL